MFIFDVSHDPLHLQVIPSRFTYEELDAHFTKIEAHYDERATRRPNAPFALLADFRRAPILDARARQRIGTCFVRITPLIEGVAKGHAIVTSNRFARGVITAVFWVKTPAWPLETFASMPQGDAWNRSMLAAAGAEQPAADGPWWTSAGAPE